MQQAAKKSEAKPIQKLKLIMEDKNPYVREAPPRYEYGNETHFEAATTAVVTPVGE